MNNRLGWGRKQERPHPRNALAPCLNCLNIERVSPKIERTGMIEWIAQKMKIIREKPQASSYFD